MTGNVNLSPVSKEGNIMAFVPHEEADHVVEGDMVMDEEIKNGEGDVGNEDDQKEDDHTGGGAKKGVKVVPAIKMVSIPWLKKFF